MEYLYINLWGEKVGLVKIFVGYNLFFFKDFDGERMYVILVYGFNI